MASSSTRVKLVTELNKYFDIREIVCSHTFERFGNKSWQFFDYQFLENLLILRKDVLQVPLICNDWHRGGRFSQRGYRCNICQLVRDATIAGRLYLTSHAKGAGGDFVSSQMTAQQMRDRTKERQHLFTVPFRVEKDVSWLHFDIYDPMEGKQYNEF